MDSQSNLVKIIGRPLIHLTAKQSGALDSGAADVYALASQFEIQIRRDLWARI